MDLLFTVTTATFAFTALAFVLVSSQPAQKPVRVRVETRDKRR